VESRAEAALAPFRETQKDYPGTDAARWARVGEANALMEEGKPAEALKAYEDAAATASGYLKFAALEGAAFALEAQEKYAEAVKRLDAAGNAAGGVYKPVAEYQAGRLLAKAGKRDEAVKRLQAMLEAEQEKAADEEAGTRPEFTSEKADAETLLRELGAAPKGKDLNIDLGAAQPGGGTPDMEALRKLVEAQLKNKQAAAPDPSSGEGDAPAAPAAAEATPPEEAEQPKTPEAQGSAP